MTIPARLGIVTLGVADVARSVAFYEALGWERCSASMEGIAWFRTADTHIGLFPWHELAADAALPAEPPRPLRRDHPGDQRRHGRRGRTGPRRGRRGRRQPAQGRDHHGLGRDVGLLRRPRRASLGDRPQPGLPDRPGWTGAHPLRAYQLTVTFSAPALRGARRRKASLYRSITCEPPQAHQSMSLTTTHLPPPQTRTIRPRQAPTRSSGPAAAYMPPGIAGRTHARAGLAVPGGAPTGAMTGAVERPADPLGDGLRWVGLDGCGPRRERSGIDDEVADLLGDGRRGDDDRIGHAGGRVCGATGGQHRPWCR